MFRKAAATEVWRPNLRIIHSSAKQVHCTFGILRKIPKKGPQSTEKQFFRFFWYLVMRKLFDKFTDFIAEIYVMHLWN